ncbi:MAG: hypothetical protein JWN85_4487 [Gammaproteobacteria bacterium]|nr:hypothetical protein [Gammaproteobacteria bacterium]
MSLERSARDASVRPVVVSDEVMPGLTGTRLARVVHHQRPDLPIVLVSDNRASILTQDALAAGMSELLITPLQSHEIASTAGPRAATQRNSCRVRDDSLSIDVGLGQSSVGAKLSTRAYQA